MRSVLLRLALFACLAFLAPTFVEAKATRRAESPDFAMSASSTFQAAVVLETSTGRVLYAYEPDTPRVAASLTKLVTALVWTSNKTLPLSRSIAIQARDEVGGGRLRVAVGSVLRFQDLWLATIASSANNAAMAVARNYGLSSDAFVLKMNAVAKKLGATSSTFADPSGMDAANTTTARDMAKIARAAFTQRDIQRAASTGEYQLTVLRPKKQVRTLKNTNALLLDGANGLYILAGKTGYLEESGYNFTMRVRPVSLDGTPDKRKDVVVVVLGAPTKEASFLAARELAEWTWNTHEFR